MIRHRLRRWRLHWVGVFSILVSISVVSVGLAHDEVITGHPGTSNAIQGQAGSAEPVKSKVVLPLASLPARGTVSALTERLSSQLGITIVAVLPKADFKRQLELGSGGGNLFDVLDRLCETGGYGYRLMGNVVVLQKDDRAPIADVPHDKLTTREINWFNSLSVAQLRKLDWYHDETLPSLTLADLQPAQRELALKLLTAQPASDVARKGSEAAPNNVKLSADFHGTAFLNVGNRDLYVDFVPSTVNITPDGDGNAVVDPKDGEAWQALTAKVSKPGAVAVRELAGRVWHIGNLLGRLKPALRDATVHARLQGLAIHITGKDASINAEDILRVLGAEVRTVGNTKFVCPSMTEAGQRLWLLCDRWRRAKRIDRVDPIDSLRNRRGWIAVRELPPSQQAMLLKFLAPYKPLNAPWKEVSDAEVIAKGKVIFAETLEMLFRIGGTRNSFTLYTQDPVPEPTQD